MKKHTFYTGFTLIEVICSISILLLLLTFLLNISSYTLHSVHTYNQEIANNQTLDNLKDYLVQEFNQNNLSILDLNVDDCLIHYQVFKKDPTSSSHYILADKNIHYRAPAKILTLTTQNTYYKKNNTDFTKLFSHKESTNILAENIESITTYQEGEKIHFSLLMTHAKESTDFYIFDRKDVLL